MHSGQTGSKVMFELFKCVSTAHWATPAVCPIDKCDLTFMSENVKRLYFLMDKR